MKSSGREQRLVFWIFLWPYQQPLGWCSSGLWPWHVSQCEQCQVCPSSAWSPGWRCRFYGSSDSLLAVITELLKNQCLEFVLLLASIALASSEHVCCGAGELSPTGRGGLSEKPRGQSHVRHELSHALPGRVRKQTASGVTPAHVVQLLWSFSTGSPVSLNFRRCSDLACYEKKPTC